MLPRSAICTHAPSDPAVCAQRPPHPEGAREVSPFCRVCLIDGRRVAAVRFTQIVVGARMEPAPRTSVSIRLFANRGHGRGLFAQRWRRRAVRAFPCRAGGRRPTTANSASAAFHSEDHTAGTGRSGRLLAAELVSVRARHLCPAWWPPIRPHAYDHTVPFAHFYGERVRVMGAVAPNPGTDRASGSCRRARGWSTAASPGTRSVLDGAHVFHTAWPATPSSFVRRASTASIPRTAGRSASAAPRVWPAGNRPIRSPSR